MEYKEFLETKIKRVQESGFNVELSDLNPALFDFQKYCVQRALKAGRFAFFQDCGLGKTIQQLEWAKQVTNHTNKPVLILCPLQLPTIERAITLWSNKGDKFLTPFMGVGSEVYQAIKMDRFGIGFELKTSYFDVAVKNVKAAESLKTQLSLL